MKSFSVIAGLIAGTVLLLAQAPAPNGAAGGSGRGGRGNVNGGPLAIPLWPNGTPGALGDTDADKPEMTFYRGGRSGTAVIIAPGGAYRALSMDTEGRSRKRHYFNAMGVERIRASLPADALSSSGRAG